MPAILDKLLRIGEGKILRQLETISAAVNAIEDDFVAMSDAELQGMTDELKKRFADGEDLDDLMPEAFATVREAAKRVIGQRHYDVQIMGGAALHMGNIAEMKTGEGKTLVATLPAYLNALTGRGVHVVTVNDYLAKYHAEWMGRVHHFLGLTTGVILPEMRPDARREAYACDITYGTNNELGFDYLRDNMASSIEDCVQRGHHFAVVDEVDSILVDEARTPLIISGPTQDEVKWYGEFAKIAKSLVRDEDYEVDEKKRTISVLEPGITKVEDHLGIENLYEAVNTPLISFLNNSIKAKELFRNDKEYVVIDGEVLIVDEHTGRMLAGRRYNDGLHQAIEAKEEVTVREEYQTLATVTLQNYFRLYEKLSGMTGTAMTEASEFDKIYGLGVVPIPTNLPMVRKDQADLVYRTEEAKYDAVVEDIAERHAKGQPILVGTVSVEKSEHLSNKLKKLGVAHSVLNAKVHADEAKIVAMAGHRGAVTVATNMAGRGTDIMLGGSVEFLADDELRKKGLEPVGETADEYEAAWPETLERVKAQVAAEHDEVRDLGGLYVVGTERHESRRIDNQLRGRSGRQGDPGESRFYLSLEDELMRLFKSDWVDRVLQVLKIPDDVPIENKRVTSAIANAQGQVESQNFESRKNVLKYDDVMDRQRKVIYGERREVLEGADIEDQVRSFIDDVVTGTVTERHRGTRRRVGPRAAVDRPRPAVAGLARPRDLPRGRRGRGRRRPGRADQDPAGRRAGGVRRARGRGGRRGHARARAPGAPVGAGPQVARAPLRDGLPARGHLPARVLAARPAGRVPARGLRDVRRDDGRHQGGGRRLPLQPRGQRGRRRRGRGGRGGRGPRADAAVGAERAAARPGSCRGRCPGVAAGPCQGSRAGQAAAEPVLLRADRAGRGRGQGQHRVQRRRPLRQGGPQRAVPVRLRQEVQDVPRPGRWPDGPDGASCRLGLTRSRGRCRATALGAARTGRRPPGTARRTARGCWSRRPSG